MGKSRPRLRENLVRTIAPAKGGVCRRLILSWLLAIFGFGYSGAAQVQPVWIARYNGGDLIGTNQAVAMAFAPDGNIVVSGSSTSTNGDFDYIVLKYAPNGSQLWASRYASPGGSNDQVRAMTLDTEGNIYVTGTSMSVKYNSAGVLQWAAPFGGRDLAADAKGNLYVTGFMENDFATVKLSSTGSNVWLRTYDRIGRPDFSQVIILDQTGGVYVGGTVVFDCTGRGPTCYNRLSIVKYNESGERVWVSEFPDAEVYWVRKDITVTLVKSIILAPSGDGIYVAGNLIGDSSGPFYVTKLNESGVQEWQNVLRHSTAPGMTKMTMDGGGQLYLTGGYPWPTDFWITFKTDPKGNAIWEKDYDNAPLRGFARGNDIALDRATNIYVTGQSPGMNSGQDFTTIKYNPDGRQLWVKRYDGPAHSDDVATAIAVAADGSFYVTGWSTTSSNLIEVTTIKYSELPAIQIQANKNVLLQFFGAPGQGYPIQASTNLVDWQTLATPVADSQGIYRYLDTNSPAYPMRFYRTLP